jgi:8-oxo-dGTP diphosphatase
MKQQITRIAAYGLIVQERRILLCRISNLLPKDAGYWTLPGGGIDFGEAPVDAMRREVAEESGLVVRPCALAAVDSLTIEEKDRAFHAIRIIYHAEIVGGARRNEVDGSTDQCAWWSYAEAQRLPLVDLAIVGLKLAFSANGTGTT